MTQRSSTVSRLVLHRARLLDARWVREEFTATRLHNGTRARYDWSTYDRVVDQERSMGLHVLGLLDYSNTWAYGDHGTMPHRDMARLSRDFAAYAHAVAAHFRGRIRAWQIWNEPNLIAFWHPSPNARDYARLLNAAYGSIKRVDRRNTVVAAGTSGVDLSFIRRVAARGGRFDVVSVHPYRLTPEVELVTDVRRLRSLHRPIWFSEIGWPAGAGCLLTCTDESAQAAYLVRFYALAAAAGVARVFWYDLRDDAHTPGSPEAHFGLLRRDLSAKPAFVAYASLARLLTGARFLRADVFNAAGVYALRFGSTHGPIEIAWNTSSADVPLHMRWRAPGAVVLTMTGEPTGVLNASRGRIGFRIPPGGEPVFLVGHTPRLALPPLGPLLHIAPPATPTPLPLPIPGRHRLTPTPGAAWAVNPGPTPKPTAQSPSHEHRLPVSGSRPRATPSPTATATATP